MDFKKSALINELLDGGVLQNGEVLRYKNKQGELLAVGRARYGGIEVQGRPDLLTYTAFEALAGSKYRRPAEHTHGTRGLSLQQGMAAVQTGSGDGAVEAWPRREFQLPNDPYCHICGLQGELIACSACPAAFHSTCLGLEVGAVFELDWRCPRCVTRREGDETARPMPLTPSPLPCAQSLAVSAPFKATRHAEVDASAASAACLLARSAWPVDFSGLVNAMQGTSTLEQAAVADDLIFKPVTALDRLCRAGAIPIAAIGGEDPGLGVDVVCLKGLRSTARASMHEGVTTPASMQQGSEGLVRQLLSVAYHLLRGCYGAVDDARTGKDLLEALLFDTDTSLPSAVVLLLRVSGVVAGAAVLAFPGPAPAPAQLLLLAVRQELWGNGLGMTLHAAAEIVAGTSAQALVTPRLSSDGLGFAQAASTDTLELARFQALLGYMPASQAVMTALVGTDSVRLPGMAWLVKPLSAPLSPVLPASLAWNEAVDLDWALQQGRAGTSTEVNAAAVHGIGRSSPGRRAGAEASTSKQG